MRHCPCARRTTFVARGVGNGCGDKALFARLHLHWFSQIIAIIDLAGPLQKEGDGFYAFMIMSLGDCTGRHRQNTQADRRGAHRFSRAACAIGEALSALVCLARPDDGDTVMFYCLHPNTLSSATREILVYHAMDAF